MWETVVTVLGALGGFEFIKWLFNRKSASRVAVAEAEASEFRTLEEMIQFLQTQLKEKEERFAEQTQLVRKLNTEVIDLTKKISALEIKLANVRCDDLACPFRKPPTANTPPHPGLTKEECHSQK